MPNQPADLYRLHEMAAASAATDGTDYLILSKASTNKSTRRFQRLSITTLQEAIAALVPAATALSPHSNQWAQTAAVTNATSAVETTLTGAGKGTLTTPLAALAVGSTFIIEAHGVLGTHSTAGVPTLKLKIGAKTLATLAPTLGNSLSAVPWRLRAVVTVTTAGAAGVVNIGGELDILPTTTSVVTAGFSAAVSSTDISAASAWDLTNTWNTSNAANTITLRTLTIDRVR